MGRLFVLAKFVLIGLVLDAVVYGQPCASVPLPQSGTLLVSVGNSIMTIRLGPGHASLKPLFTSKGGTLSGLLPVPTMHRVFATDVVAQTGGGSLFEVYRDGSHYRKLHTFRPANVDLQTLAAKRSGILPVGNLAVNKQGTLFGCCYLGGSGGTGLVYRIKSNGDRFKVIHTFLKLNHLGINRGGAEPKSGVLLGADGWLYGICSAGGTHGVGTIFKLSPTTQQFRTVYNFPNLNHRYRNSSGCNPHSLTLMGDGTLVGTTFHGGKFGGGTLYQISGNGTDFRVLHSFGASKSDGINPGSIVLTPAGRVFGVTEWGGKGYAGTLYRYGPDKDSYAVLARFTFKSRRSADVGANPVSISRAWSKGVLLITSIAGEFNHGALSFYSTRTRSLVPLLAFKN